jgi:VanZ family protein
LAALSGAVLDIPPRIRALLLVAGIAGVGIVVMESLVGRQAGTIQVDKILHFSGYAILALVFILALRPALYLPSLVGLVAVGVGIEYLQPLNGRSFELRDAYADMLGVAIGAAVGIVGRSIYAHIRSDLAVAASRSRLTSCAPGTVILREGEPIRAFAIIRKGEVELVRTVAGEPVLLSVAGPGEVLGAVAAIQGGPAGVTATARTWTSLYHMDLEELMQSAGGRELPVSTVLRSLAEHLRQAVERITELEASSP